LNPTNGSLSRALFPGKTPMRLAADGQGNLYIAMSATASIARYNVQQGTLTGPISLDPSYTLLQMKVVSAQKQLLAISHASNEKPPRAETLLIEKGSALPDSVHFSNFAVSSDGQSLYTKRQDSEEVNFQQAAVTPTGLQLISNIPLYGFSQNLEAIGDKLYFGSGQVLDTRTFHPIALFGDIGDAGFCLPDLRSDLIYFVSYGIQDWDLAIFERGSQKFVGKLALPPLAQPTRKMFYWGERQLGFLTAAGELYLVDPDQMPRVNLTISESSFSSLHPHMGEEFTVNTTLKNQGPESAQNVSFSQMISGSELLSATSSKGTIRWPGGIAARIDRIDPGETVSFTYIGRVYGFGALDSVSGVSSEGLDLDPNDNSTEQVIPIEQPISERVSRFVLETMDIVGNSQSEHLYVGTGPYGSYFRNSILDYDPRTGIFTRIAQFEISPARLALSADGEILYAALGKEIARVNLHNPAVVTRFQHGLSEPLQHIHVFPGNNASILVISADGAAIFDDGIERGVAGPSGSIAIIDGQHGVEYDSNAQRFRKLIFSQAGMIATDFTFQPISQIQDIIYTGGKVFTSQGLALDSVDGAEIGRLKDAESGSLLCADATRVFLLSYKNPGCILRVYDSDTFQMVGQFEFPELPGFLDFPMSLTKFGKDLIAFRTSANEMFIIDLAAYSTADVALSQSFEPSNHKGSQPFTYTLTLTNQGPGIATNFAVVARIDGPVTPPLTVVSPGLPGLVTITGATNSGIIRFPNPFPIDCPPLIVPGGGTLTQVVHVGEPAVTIPLEKQSASQTMALALQTSNTISAGNGNPGSIPQPLGPPPYTVQAQIPLLAPGDSATVTITITPSSAGVFELSANINRDGFDLDLSNNSVRNTLVIPPEHPLVQVFAIPHNDFGYDKVTSKIILCTKSGIGQFASSLVTLDSTNFELDRITNFPSQPLKIALQPEGGRAVFALESDCTAYYFETASGQIRPAFSLHGRVQDIQIPPGQPDWAVVASSPDPFSGVQLYVNGQTSGSAVASGIIAFSQSPNLLYDYSPAEGFLRRLKVDSTGISLIDYSPSLLSGPLNMLQINGKLLTSAAKLYDPDKFELVATLPDQSPGTIAVDSASNRLFLLNSSGSGNSVKIFDATTYELKGLLRMPLPEAAGVRRVLATSGDQLVLSTGTYIYILNFPPNAVDLEVSSFFPDPLYAGVVSQYRFTVIHNGPWVAHDVQLHVKVPPEFLVSDANSSPGEVKRLGDDLILNLATLQPGESATITLTGSFPVSGTNQFEVSAEALQPDVFSENNHLTKQLTISTVPPPPPSFAIINPTIQNGLFTFSFPTSIGRQYLILSSKRVDSSISDLEVPPLQGDGNIAILKFTPAAEMQFFRVFEQFRPFP
jgi:hypothetical protein